MAHGCARSCARAPRPDLSPRRRVLGRRLVARPRRGAACQRGRLHPPGRGHPRRGADATPHRERLWRAVWPGAPEENPLTEETLPRPANPYAVAKVAQDLTAYQYYRTYGLDVVRARAFNHFGPGQSPTFVIASFAQQIAQIEAGIEAEPTLLVGNLSAERDFLPVGEVIAAYLALAAQGQAGEAYNIGSGVARSIESVLEQLLAMARVAIAVHVDPQRFRPAYVPQVVANTTKIQRDTDWRPSATLDAGLLATLDYWRLAAQAPSASRWYDR